MKKLVQFVLMLLLSWPYLIYCWKAWERGDVPASFMGWARRER